MTGEPAQAAFDAVAPGYDARFTDQPITRRLRAQVMQGAQALLPPGRGRVLEIGCGTGEDALTFARHGHRILATDASGQMIRVARDKAADHRLIETLVWAVGQPLPQAVSVSAPFDLIFSNFGAINCIEDLDDLGRACAGLVAPSGHVVLVIINRWCLTEIVLGALRANRAAMTRRFRKKQVTKLEDGTRLAVQFPSRRDMVAHMGPRFTLVHAAPVGVFFPPSEYYTAFQRRPWLMRLAAALEASMARLWPFSRLADHEMLVFRALPQQPGA